MTQRILLVEDDTALAEALQDTLEESGFAVSCARHGGIALERLEQQPFHLVVSDVHMQGMDGHALLREIKDRQPDLPVLLMTAYASVERAVQAMREGAVDYLMKPFEADVLVAAVTRYALSEHDDSAPVAEDPASIELLALARRVAQSEATVLLTGESGSGKEVIARYIHNHSTRAAGPFVAINCAAIPENMLEATLFGYQKGAFTGAYKASPGKFEQAQHGTLLLDEISEMDLALQAKLLRVLQERELERLGGGKVIDLDVRVLATSNRDMRAEVEKGRFREDLYYRLNVFPLHLLPLRERPADIVPMAQLLLERACRQSGTAVPQLTPEAEKRLREYPWPGNVRELDNMMQRAQILATGDHIDEQALHFEQVTRRVNSTPETPSGGRLTDDLKQREYERIMLALESGSRKAAAEQLGISPRTLRYKL
ncbi:MAG: sigma-54-dependent transcriptional regulator, partial [Pseudomonadota bacterium]